MIGEIRFPWASRAAIPSLATRMAGIALCAVLAELTMRLAAISGIPGLALCLCVGLLIGWFTRSPVLESGAEFARSYGLRIGIALLGFRLDVGDLAGAGTSLATAGLVVATSIAAGLIGARLMKLPLDVGFISGAGTGICGVSAVLACAGLSRKRDGLNADITIIIAWISILSSMSMLGWSLFGSDLGWSPGNVGMVIGASIHDVAQATAAGYALSHEAGDAATVAKMARVVMLIPVTLIAPLLIGGLRTNGGFWSRIPAYLPAFALLALLSSLDAVPPVVGTFGIGVSQVCMAAAMFAIGMGTPWRNLVRSGLRIPTLLVAECAIVNIIALTIVHLLFG